MPVAKCSDEEFIAIWRALGSPSLVAERLRVNPRNALDRRRSIENRYQILLPTTNDTRGQVLPSVEFERTRAFTVTDGVVIFFTDPHWLPDHSTVMQDAILKACDLLKPKLIICGGDAFDGTQISRWEPTRGHHKPADVRTQLESCVDHFDEIREACPSAEFGWTLGNHDIRLSRFVAVNAEQLLSMPYTRLEDWVKGWPISWRIDINPSTPGMTVIRHRNMAGMLHLQAQKAGCHYVHGHLHKLNAHRFATFNGVRYSIDGGSVGDPTSDAFDYAEGSPDHQQGFVVLTYRKGNLMPPELVESVDGKAWFRGSFL
jgi:hypothetical protein